MAGLFDKQAEIYADARPTYPRECYQKLAALTPGQALAWDLGTGNGQAALGVAEHYQQVIAMDVSESQLNYAIPHPRVRYLHTPPSISDDELLAIVGGENSVDLITVAQAIHWFELPKFYSLVNPVLRKLEGVIAVWGYQAIQVSPTFDSILKIFFDATLPYWNSNIRYVSDQYKTLPFPFESVDLGSEGNPVALDIPTEVSFKGILGILRSWSAVATAKEQGVELLSEGVVREFKRAWGGTKLARNVVYKAFMLAGKVKK
ncbi:putative methyltransferase DDB_G0268948 [Eucalyptus grandis]|uniref:putative methyltransferase DDB_G0268948 n=1 Tax=Eucalyptus grandis TaxID=71139 RepID=UPI00192EF97F|nr:putative methyltransferase DDB_G0268948 [Eucalyptus grandis]